MNKKEIMKIIKGLKELKCLLNNFDFDCFLDDILNRDRPCEECISNFAVIMNKIIEIELGIRLKDLEDMMLWCS